MPARRPISAFITRMGRAFRKIVSKPRIGIGRAAKPILSPRNLRSTP